jgi:hypothetical protein
MFFNIFEWLSEGIYDWFMIGGRCYCILHVFGFFQRLDCEIYLFSFLLRMFMVAIIYLCAYDG